jgi:arginyl-tRNA synthetase
VFLTLKNRLREVLAGYIREKYEIDQTVVLERPPKIEMGEAASPVCFELAKRLKRAPRQIAQEIAIQLPKVEGISRIEVAGAGYLNVYFDRRMFWETSAQWSHHATHDQAAAGAGKIIVEHTSINPNKAAHIGHVRNAVLGDTMARTLRHAGRNVQVQNYIDNTGVQVADVVIGFLHMERRSPITIKMMAMEPKFDYLCWDLYAAATKYFAEDQQRAAELRGATLKAIEEGRGEEAEVAEVVADAIVGCHLKTMSRLDISYDLLARESEILHLHFWDAAFAKLREKGVVQLALRGKMSGCWIMPWHEEGQADADEADDAEPVESPEEENSQDKIIVRSNGTVTYVGKDIAYQMWKFGLLGKDFRYSKWPETPHGEAVWATTGGPDDETAPNFGEPAREVYNVIDARQAYLQKVVTAGIRALGHPAEADHSIHLSYEIVALTPRCAAEMGYEIAPEDSKKPYVEVSGRKGLGVKADDLLDQLQTATLAEVHQRHADMSELEQVATARAIAVGALRFFLLKFTRNAIIAFDFRDALSFEGETGPYCQYAVVRIRGIRRKGAEANASRVAVNGELAVKLMNEPDGLSLWALLLDAGSLEAAVDSCIGAQEPAFLAKYAFQLAQAFNNFYHKHHILSEADPEKQSFLLALTELVERQLVRALSLLGMTAPEKM